MTNSRRRWPPPRWVPGSSPLRAPTTSSAEQGVLSATEGVELGDIARVSPRHRSAVHYSRPTCFRRPRLSSPTTRSRPRTRHCTTSLARTALDAGHTAKRRAAAPHHEDFGSRHPEAGFVSSLPGRTFREGGRPST